MRRALRLWFSRLTLLTAMACLSCAAKGDSQIPTVTEIPTPQYKPEDSIDALDFVVDQRGVVHLVWLSGLTSKPLPSPAIWYQSGDPRKGTWTQAICLGSSNSRPRIVSDGSTLHVLFGRKLAHFESRDLGKSWQSLTSALESDSVGANVFDAIAADGQLTVAYVARPRAEVDGITATSVWMQRYAAGKWDRPVRFTTPSVQTTSTLPDPRLVSDGDSLYFLYGINEEVRRDREGDSGMYQEVGFQARLFLSRSGDHGLTWSNPAEVKISSQPTSPISAWEVELAKLRGHLMLVLSTPMLLGTTLGPSGEWSEVSVIKPFEGPEGSKMWSPSAAVRNGEGWLLWIDDRYRQRDSAAGELSVLSDQPYWADNDVFAVPLSSLLSASAGATHREPLRLTTEHQRAEEVRARATDDGVYVVWTGRAKVGKNRRSAGAPPAFFVSVFPRE